MKKCTGNLLLKTAESAFFFQLSVISKKFEDIKGVIRNRKSKKDSQYNGQKKKTNNHQLWKSRSWLGTGNKCGGVKLVDGIPIPPLLITGSLKAIHIR